MTLSDFKQQSIAALGASLRIVLLVGSQALGRGLEVVLGGIPNIASVTEADPVSLARLLKDGDVDVVVVSVDQWPALANCADNSTLMSDVKVLVIGDDLYMTHPKLLSSLPANGFVSMADLSVERLSDTLDRVLGGEMPMPPELARHLLSGVHPPAARTGHRSSLTSRETETLALLVKGMSNKQIARALGISTHGAKRLVTAILLKLGVPNRTAAVVEAMQSGLV